MSILIVILNVVMIGFREGKRLKHRIDEIQEKDAYIYMFPDVTPFSQVFLYYLPRP